MNAGWSAETWTAIATVSIAAFTLVLMAATIWQGRFTSKMINLAREEFIATHRPKVRVRAVRRFAPENAFWSARAIIINCGESGAVIDAVDMRLMNRDEIEPALDNAIVDIFPAHQPSTDKTPLVPGARRVLFQTSIIQRNTMDEILDETNICVIGRIVYLDKNGTQRQTGFFWAWDSQRHRFGPVEGHELTYEE